MSPDDPRHGTRAGYSAHRRAGQDACADCRRANTRDHKLFLLGRKPRLIDPLGTHRRIRALLALGWTHVEIARHCGLTTRGWTSELLRAGQVRQDTAAAIARAYDAMSGQVPQGKYRDRGRSIARAKGWPPPLAWDDIDRDPEPPSAAEVDDVDEVAVERILRGDWRLSSTRAERVEVCRRWVEQGRGSLAELERRTGWKVHRYYRLEAA